MNAKNKKLLGKNLEVEICFLNFCDIITFKLCIFMHKYVIDYFSFYLKIIREYIKIK